MALNLSPGRAPNPGSAAVKAPKPPQPVTPQGNPGLAAAAGNASSGGGTTTVNGVKIVAPAAVSQYGNGAPAPAPAPAAPVAPTLDATALANIANYLTKTNQSITADQGDIDQDKLNDPIQQLKLMTAANAGGGLYGSAYGQQQGNLTAQQNYNIGQLTNAIANLQESIPVYNSQQASASAERASEAAAKNAPVPVTAATAAAPVTKVAATSSRPNVVAQAQGKANNTQLKKNGTPMGGLR